MAIPLSISYREVRASDALEDLIRREADKLDHIYKRIISCRVSIEPASARHRAGDPIRVTIVLEVPGDEIVTSHLPAMRGTLLSSEDGRVHKSTEVDAPKDLATAVREAFKKAKRQLQGHVNKLVDGRQHSPAHATAKAARVPTRKQQ